MTVKRLRCTSCSTFLTTWGTTAAGTKRYYCRLCKRSRTFRKKQETKGQLFSLFRQYVLWGDTYEQLSSCSSYSVSHLIRIFHQFLSTAPPALSIPPSTTEETFLLIDGLWFGRWFVLMVYRQSKNLTILRISVGKREVATKVAKDLRWLKEQGYRFTGVVSDGQTGIVKAIHTVHGHIPHQICLAHMHRGIIAAIGRYPKDFRVKELKAIADWVWLIESKEALRWWEDWLKRWVTAHWLFVWERRRDTEGHWWYIHKGVKKAMNTLLALPQTSFAFLSHPLMPKTTNELEAQFGHLGHRWITHRGLKRERWEPFLSWFVYFYNQEKLSSRKRKAD